MEKAKRVRFMDPVPAQSPSCGLAAPSAPYDANESAKSGGPKTSEYAFFKKFKQDIGGSSCSYPVHKASRQLSTSTSHNHVEEKVKMKQKDLQSSSLVEKTKHDSSTSFLSPQCLAIKDSGKTTVGAYDKNNSKFASLMKNPTTSNLDSLLSPTFSTFKNLERQSKKGEIFAVKRQKLRERIAQALFREDNKISEGYDLVSLLLGRLLPDSTQNSMHPENPELRQAVTEDKFQLIPASDTQTEENLIPSWNLVTRDDGEFILCGGSGGFPKNFRKRVPSVGCTDKLLLGYTADGDKWGDLSEGCRYSVDRSEDRTLLNWKTEDHDSPAASANNITLLEHKRAHSHSSFEDFDWFLNEDSDSFPIGFVETSNLDYDRAQSDLDLDGDPELSFASSPSFGVSVIKYDDSALRNLMELDESDDRHESDILLPSQYICSSSHDAEPKACLLALPSWSACHELSMAKPGSRSRLFQSSLLHESFFYTPSHRCKDHDFETNRRSDFTPLALTYSAEQLDPDDASDGFIKVLNGSSFLLLPKDHFWFKENIVFDRNHLHHPLSNTEALLISSRPNTDFGLNCNLISDFPCEYEFQAKEDASSYTFKEDCYSAGKKQEFSSNFPRLMWIDNEHETNYDDNKNDSEFIMW